MKNRDRFRLGAAFLFVYFLSLGFISSLWAQEPFYKGKTIRIIVGLTPGGMADRLARLYAKYLPKYIAGGPEIVIQNMPGAGTKIAAGYVYSVAKGDGLTLGMFLSGIYLDQVVGRKEVQYDVRKFGWIGSQAPESIILYMRANAPYRSVGDIVKAQQPPRCGSSGTTSSDYILTKVLELTVGAKINSVLGYPGGPEIDLAVEKGEVHCRAHTLSSHFGREPFDSWHKKGFDRHLVQTGRKRDARAADTPTIYELMEEFKTPDIARRVVQVMLAGGEIGRSLVVSSGTSQERLKLLREAYSKMLKDPEFLDEAKKQKLDVDPSTGEELEALVKQIMEQPKEVIDRVKELVGN
jgi:tripartite-type tricarboxylate transporter receptor subunit TctC